MYSTRTAGKAVPQTRSKLFGGRTRTEYLETEGSVELQPKKNVIQSYFSPKEVSPSPSASPTPKKAISWSDQQHEYSNLVIEFDENKGVNTSTAAHRTKPEPKGILKKPDAALVFHARAMLEQATTPDPVVLNPSPLLKG